MGKYYIKLNRNNECTKCHKTSQKGGECWEKGLCARCYDTKTLTCKQCGGTSNNRNGGCWKSEGICGRCAKRQQAPKKYEPQYKLCPKCYDRLSALYYTKNTIHINSHNYVCPGCREIFILNDKFKVYNGQ